MLAGGILGYVFIDTVQYTMETEMYSSLKQYGSDQDITAAWDAIQQMVGHNVDDFLNFFFLLVNVELIWFFFLLLIVSMLRCSK